jgi:hypothetical protein
LQGDGFQGKRVGGIEAEQRLDGGDIFNRLDVGGCAADGDRGTRRVSSETIAVDLNYVAAGVVPGAGQSF